MTQTTFQTAGFQYARAHEAKPRQWSFLHWLAQTYIPTWEIQERDIVDRNAGKGWCDSTERELIEALTNRGDTTFRL
jgi:hypothetical protein